MRRIKLFLVIMGIVGLCACAKNSGTSSLYTPTAADVTSTATLADLQQGRTLYINNCGRCHSLYSPDAFSPSSWKTIVPTMAGNAGLTASQATLVTKYVTRGQ